MVDIETYRARIGNFGVSGLSTSKLKLKIKLRCKVQIQMSMECSVQTLIFLCMVTSTMLCVSLHYQEQGNTYTGKTPSHTDSLYSGTQLCIKCLFEHVHELYRYILESYVDMLTEMSLFYTPPHRSSLALKIWTPGTNTQATLMENIFNGTIHGTCSYLIGNVGCHAYNGNPPKKGNKPLWDLHNEMVLKLSETLAPGTGNEYMEREWHLFTNMLRRPDLLYRVEVARLKSMFDVFNILMEKAKIDYGNYEVVKRILSQLQLIKCLDIITEYEERMASTPQYGQQAFKIRRTETDVTGGNIYLTPEEEKEIQNIRKLEKTVEEVYTTSLNEALKKGHNILNEQKEATIQYERSLQHIKNMKKRLQTKGIDIDNLENDTAETLSLHSQSITYSMSSPDTIETAYSRQTAASGHNKMSSATSEMMNTYIQTLSEEERAIYDNSLKDGKETYRHIRVLYVGDSGVGKTTLCKNITGKEVIIGNEPSTDGAAVFMEICEVSLDGENEWKILGDKYEDKENVIAKRLAAASAPEMADTTETVYNRDTAASSHNQMPSESTENKSPNAIGTQESDRRLVNNDSHTQDISDAFETNVGDEKKEDDVQFINQVVKEKQENPSKKAFVSMWDFAGQEDYYSTHHIFLSSHAVFVLVCNAEQCLKGTDKEKKSAHEKIAFWLRSIKTYAKSDDATRQITTETPRVDNAHSPPIIFVGTHADNLPGNDYDQFYELPMEIKETQEKCEDINILRAILVDNSKENNDGIRLLKSSIVEAAKYQDRWEEVIPAKWLELERSILKEKAKGVNVLTMEEVTALNEKNLFPLQTEDEINMFLRYLHASRTVVYFGEDAILSRKVIINPQWLIDAFKRLITNECFVEKTHPSKFGLWKNLQLTAKLTDELIDCAWEEENSFIEKKDTLVAVLERFGLISEPSKLPPDSDKYYFVPHLLKDPDLPSFRRLIESEGMQHKHPSPSLYLMFHEQNVPQDIYDRLISSFISLYKLDAKDTKALGNCIKRGFGFFKFDYHCSFIILCRPSFISLTLFCNDDTHRNITDQGTKLREFTEKRLNIISKTNRKTEFGFNYAFCCEYDVEDPIPLKEFRDNITSIRCPCKRIPEHYITQTDLQIWGFKTEIAAEVTEKPKTDPGSGPIQVTYNVIQTFQGDNKAVTNINITGENVTTGDVGCSANYST